MEELDRLLESYDLSQMENGLESLFPGVHIPVTESLERLFRGDIVGCFQSILRGFGGAFYLEVSSYRKVFVWLVILGILSGILALVTGLFEQIRNTQYCYYVVFLAVTAISLRAFTSMLQIGRETVENIVLFMRLMLPTYFVTVGVSLGMTTAGILYQGILLLLLGIEKLIVSFGIQAVIAYVLLITLNGLWAGDKCSYMIRFLEKALQVGMRTMLVLVSGMGFLHSVIAPVTDRMGKLVLLKTVEMIPGAGKPIEGASELLLGAATIIKNGVGVFLFMVLCGICLVPLLQLFLTSFCMKAAASFMGFISEARIASLVNGYADGLFLLLRLVATALFMFVIALGFITAMSVG